jgi:hypothetical protein
MYTFQDFENAQDKVSFCSELISYYKTTREYRIAVDADLYDRQLNSTINDYVNLLFTASGAKMQNIIASNNKIASNFYRRLNTQRNMYSLGNGVTFKNASIKDKLGKDFDTRLKKAGYYSLKHGVSYMYWLKDHVSIFKATEFVPLFDEYTGDLRAGVRFYQIDVDRPISATLYEEDGYTEMQSDSKGNNLKALAPKRGYIQHVVITPAEGEKIIGEENYPSLPIVPLYASELKQSTLVGMKQAIDSYDLIRSGFANDISDCSEIYWIVKNAGGMSDKDLDKLRIRMLRTHFGVLDTDDKTEIEPHTQDIPFQARTAFLEQIKSDIYSNFGALDVQNISASAVTATQINAAYQPLDENADDYEYQIIDCIHKLLSVAGLPIDTPIFKRNRIANISEEIQNVIMEAPYLDDETLLKKLPNITDDEVNTILDNKTRDEANRYETEEDTTEDDNSEETKDDTEKTSTGE